MHGLVLIEHALYLRRIVCLRQRQAQQNAGLLGVEIVRGDAVPGLFSFSVTRPAPLRPLATMTMPLSKAALICSTEASASSTVAACTVADAIASPIATKAGTFLERLRMKRILVLPAGVTLFSVGVWIVAKRT